MGRTKTYQSIIDITSIRTHLIGSLSWLIVLLGCILGVAFLAIYHLRMAQQRNETVFRPSEYYAYQVLEGLHENKLLLKEMIFVQDTLREPKLLFVKWEKLWKNKILLGNDTLKYLISRIEDTEVSESYRQIRVNIQNIRKDIQAAFQTKEIISFASINSPISSDTTPTLKKLFFYAPIDKVLNTSILNLTEETNDLFAELIEKNKVIQSARNLRLENWLSVWFWLETILVGIWILSVILLVRNTQKRIENDTKLIRKFVIQLNRGNIPAKIFPQNREFQRLSSALNKLIKQLQNLRKFAITVIEDTPDEHILLFENKGNLGKSLAQMRNTLQKASEENAIRYWTNTGVAKFSEILTKYASDLDKLTDLLISDLVVYLEVNQGGFFVLESEGDATFMELKSSFAYNKKRFLDKRIEKGQGLIGQVWNEGDLTYLKEIPDKYLEITSGLGASTPKVLLIVPVKSGKDVHGIIELASFEEIPTYKIDFIRKIAENAGQAIASARINAQTKKLLYETQELAQTLQTQEEQMRQNMQELQETQALMDRTQKELAEKEANLQALINNTSHAIIAFDKNYKITVANKVIRRMYLESGIELEVGKNLMDILPKEEFEKRRNEYFRVMTGEKFVVLEQIGEGEKQTFYELHYNPIIDEIKQVIGASIFIENITQRKQAELQLKDTEANLSSVINDTEDAILAVDKDYRLIMFNDTVFEKYQSLGLEIKLGTHIFDFMNEKEKEKWKEFFDMALKGERFVKIIDSGKFPHKTYVEHWFNPIKNDQNQVTGISVFSRDVTTAKQSENKIKQLLLESLEATENLKQQEAEMKIKIADYEMRIKELESSRVEKF